MSIKASHICPTAKVIIIDRSSKAHKINQLALITIDAKTILGPILFILNFSTFQKNQNIAIIIAKPKA